jgi:hypothetical protein
VPVVQLVWPVWQTFRGVHDRPAEHALQLPRSQTLLVPQPVPFGTLPDDTQRGAPVEQSMTPVLHRFDGEHVPPAAQVLHEPLSQTWLAPHGDPFGSLALVSVHDGVPPVQASTPAWHGLAGVQAAPGEQVAHEPLSQTLPVPQLVPSATLPVSPQTGAPVEQPMEAV